MDGSLVMSYNTLQKHLASGGTKIFRLILFYIKNAEQLCEQNIDKCKFSTLSLKKN